MSEMKLDAEEKELLESYEADEWQSVDNNEKVDLPIAHCCVSWSTCGRLHHSASGAITNTSATNSNISATDSHAHATAEVDRYSDARAITNTSATNSNISATDSHAHATAEVDRYSDARANTGTIANAHGRSRRR